MSLKNSLIHILLMFISIPLFSQNEGKREIYDHGNPDAIVVLDDLTIYTWEGKPCAYLLPESKNNNIHLYGFNGKHLGWYDNDTFYNNDGKIIGVFWKKWSGMHFDRMKYKLSYLKPAKSLIEIPPLKPLFLSSWFNDNSKISLSKYLLLGIN